MTAQDAGGADDGWTPDGHGEAAARLTGAAEALSVLKDRNHQERQRASQYAVALLTAWAETADWSCAGLHGPGGTQTRPRNGVPIDHQAVVRLAQVASQLQCLTLRMAQRPQRWTRLTEFFTQHLPAADLWLVRLRERALSASVDAGDVAPDVVSGLTAALESHRLNDGEDAYLTGLARANLAVAYRQRAQGTDLADATALMAEEARTRAGRYGSCHPFTLVARSLHTRSLLVQAEATGDQEQRLALARQALDEVSEVRPVRDRLYGATSATATRSRRYEGHALFLLGDLTRARSCLEQALLFEATRHDNPEWAGWGHTHLLLARVYAALGDLDLALQHAGDSYWLLSQDVPAGPSCRAAAALLKELRNGRESRRQAITADRPTRP